MCRGCWPCFLYSHSVGHSHHIENKVSFGFIQIISIDSGWFQDKINRNQFAENKILYNFVFRLLMWHKYSKSYDIFICLFWQSITFIILMPHKSVLYENCRDFYFPRDQPETWFLYWKLSIGFFSIWQILTIIILTPHQNVINHCIELNSLQIWSY